MDALRRPHLIAQDYDGKYIDKQTKIKWDMKGKSKIKSDNVVQSIIINSRDEFFPKLLRKGC